MEDPLPLPRYSRDLLCCARDGIVSCLGNPQPSALVRFSGRPLYLSTVCTLSPAKIFGENDSHVTLLSVPTPVYRFQREIGACSLPLFTERTASRTLGRTVKFLCIAYMNIFLLSSINSIEFGRLNNKYCVRAVYIN